MTGRRLRVADVLRAQGAEHDRTHPTAPHQRNAVRHIVACRTAALGGHLHRCESCGSEVPVYNSCLDRHCPTCQALAKEEWLADRRAELLPVEYFHTVFTLPHALNPLIDANRTLLLGDLFATVNWVLQRFAADPQWRLEGQLGFLAVLHTWTQLLTGHFHLHCIIPGGAWRAPAKLPNEAGQPDSGRWVSCRRRFLFGKQPLCDAFRNRYLKRLAARRAAGKLAFRGGATGLADPAAWNAFLAGLASQPWVAHLMPTAAGPEQALDYLGRYVHRVAIGDHRILALDGDRVRFSYRDRSDDNRPKVKELPAVEFIHRFLYHVLPDGFRKIRYYGWMAPAAKTPALAAIRTSLSAPPPDPRPPDEPPPEETPADRILRLTGVDVRRCPHCGASALVRVRLLEPARTTGPP
jgi:predicted RNA-binding Zn-ribbon protein involved in translation (DUF1610 family)